MERPVTAAIVSGSSLLNNALRTISNSFNVHLAQHLLLHPYVLHHLTSLLHLKYTLIWIAMLETAQEIDLTLAKL